DADATDADLPPDTLTYSLTGVIPADGSGNALFSINSSNGEIILTTEGAAVINYESGVTSYTLDVQASDGLHTSNTETITINLTPVNEFTPVLTLDNASVNLAETAAAGVIADADATDADRPGDPLSYSLTGIIPADGSGNALFSINSSN